jgi:hypothetical protein
MTDNKKNQAYKETSLTVTTGGTIIIRRAGRAPFEVPGKLTVWDLLLLCDQLANVNLPVRAIPVDSDDRGQTSGMPPRQGIPDGPGRH